MRDKNESGTIQVLYDELYLCDDLIPTCPDYYLYNAFKVISVRNRL